MLMNEALLQVSSGQPYGTWTAWDDFRAFKSMDAPVMIPKGSTTCTGLTPGRFLQDTHITRPGEEYTER